MKDVSSDHWRDARHEDASDLAVESLFIIQGPPPIVVSEIQVVRDAGPWVGPGLEEWSINPLGINVDRDLDTLYHDGFALHREIEVRALPGGVKALIAWRSRDLSEHARLINRERQEFVDREKADLAVFAKQPDYRRRRRDKSGLGIVE